MLQPRPFYLRAAGALVFAVIWQSTLFAQAKAPTPAECGIPGHHALLERMSEAFDLDCDQERKLEPLLHDEESVSKPLINFRAFTPEEKKDVMREVKIAARKQILPLLTPEQQTKMEAEIDTVSKGGEGLQKGNGNGGHRKKANTTPVDPFEAEQALCRALQNYSAFSPEQKKELIRKVEQASIRPDAPQMSPDQQNQIRKEIAQEM